MISDSFPGSHRWVHALLRILLGCLGTITEGNNLQDHYVFECLFVVLVGCLLSWLLVRSCRVASLASKLNHGSLSLCRYEPYMHIYIDGVYTHQMQLQV